MAVFIKDDYGLVWDFHLYELLVEHRIMGHFMGRNGQLPVKLLPEQVKLAIELGLVKTVKSEYSTPSKQELDHYNKMLNDELEEFKNRKLEYETNMRNLYTSGRADEARIIDRPLAPLITETESTKFPWYSCQDESFEWPKTEMDIARYRVFKHLYYKSYFIVSGSKFGGDYLLYENRIEDCHAKYIVLVRDQISPLEMISHARVGTQTKKIFIMATFDHSKDKVTCVTFEWTGWV